MQRSLLNNTAQLGLDNGGLRNFPRNTADAVVSGVIRATTGAIRYQFALLAAQNPAHCIVSGGAASALLPHLDMQAQQVDNLVLHGLQIIAQS